MNNAIDSKNNIAQLYFIIKESKATLEFSQYT